MLTDEKAKLLDTRVKQTLAKWYADSNLSPEAVHQAKLISDMVVTTTIITLREYEKIKDE